MCDCCLKIPVGYIIYFYYKKNVFCDFVTLCMPQTTYNTFLIGVHVLVKIWKLTLLNSPSSSSAASASFRAAFASPNFKWHFDLATRQFLSLGSISNACRLKIQPNSHKNSVDNKYQQNYIFVSMYIFLFSDSFFFLSEDKDNWINKEVFLARIPDDHNQSFNVELFHMKLIATSLPSW